MISFLDPKFWLALILWTAGVAFMADHRATKIEHAAAEARELKISSAAKDEKAAVDDARNRLAIRLAEDSAAGFQKYHEEYIHEKAASDQLIADLRTRNKRLLVPVTGSVCTTGADAAAGPVGGTEGKGRAELTQPAAEFLVGLLARGDQAILKHAAVVDAYAKLRAACLQE